MDSCAIRVDNLGKWYRINELRYGPMLSHRLGSMLKSLWSSKTSGEANSSDGHHAIWALRGVTFDVPRGYVMGVLGKNGSGKSTLLKILARITSPTEGAAMLCGRVGALLEVGTGFHPDLSGRENILLNGSILGMSPKQIELCERAIIEFSEIGEFIDTPVKHYSSGMFMRLAFAVAAHLDAEIMIIDEALAVGDTAFQDKCKNKIHEIAQSGRTVLLASHDMGAVRRLCHGCIVLDHGALIHVGDTEAGIRYYSEYSSKL
jgi:lipopolysaccharide transport system ATP-binding protein